MNDSEQPRRKVAGFRPGQDLEGAPPPPPPVPAQRRTPPGEMGFTEAAEAGGTDLDVLMGYQIFLGRDPENSFVIADAKSSPVRAFLRALMGSGEFQSGVLDPLMAGRPLPHERSSAGPPAEQREWLLRFLDLDAIGQAGLRDSTLWRDFLRVLVALPGFPGGRASEAASAPAGVAAEAASRGFVLISIDQPKPGEAVHPGSRINGSGYAIAPADVTEVAVFIDDRLLTHASYGLPRPDVARGFPHYRHVDHCGFSFAAEVPADLRLTPESQLVVEVRTGLGDVGRKGVRIGKQAEPTAGSADRAGASWPIRVFVEDAVVNRAGVLRLRGWAASEARMEAVTVHLGDSDLGEAETGLPRPDIGRDFPQYPNAAHSGFGMMRRLEDWQPGPGYVRVQVRDAAGRQRQAIVPVTLPELVTGAERDTSVLDDADWSLSDIGADGIRICCDDASLGEDGSLHLSGWALADSGVAGISVALDGAELGDAATGGARKDLRHRFPDNPAALKAGFTFRHRGRAVPAPGPHALTLRVRSRSGDEHVVELRVTPESATGAGGADADMRLEIDRPLLDGDVAIAAVRGALTISGWAVARGGVDHVAILSDGAILGRAYLGMRREDIGAAFPDFEGSQLSGFALVLPPGTLPSGTHDIAVVARARGGAAETSKSFSLTVEEQDNSQPGGAIRRSMPPAEAAFGLRVLESRGHHPSFRIVLRADGAPPDLLAQTIASLIRQIYRDWTALILVENRAAASSLLKDAASLPGWTESLSARLQPVLPGAARARPFASAPGPAFILSLRAGDELGCDALLEFAMASAIEPDAGLLYADEVRQDPTRDSRQVWAKPGFSPELLLATNYVGRVWCASDTVLNDAGLTPAQLGETSDYDAALRLCETAEYVTHAGHILLDAGPAGDTAGAEKAALSAALARRRMKGRILSGRAPGTWRVARALSPRGRVSIVIPTCGTRELIRTAISTIRATTAPRLTGGRHVEIVVVDNVPASERALKLWLSQEADVIVDAPGAFNWSRFNNMGAAASSGDTLLFLNDDIEAPEPGWLEALLEHAQQPDVGVVGARLLYPDGKVQHAGQYLADFHARHAFRFAEGDSPGPFGLAAVSREMMSVTGACLMTPRSAFERIGGFEEAHSVVNNDLDYCLRAWAEGLAVIYTPHATLIHHELASRAGLADIYDEARFTGAWRDRFLAGDPFRNAALRADDDHYSIDTEPTSLVHVGRKGPALTSIKRILAVKLDHIGDFLTALPALRSLRRRFPDARIDLLAPPASASLARAGGVVDEVIEFTFFHARSGQGQRQVTAAEFEALAARLAERHYDMAIDLRMQPETREALRCSGAPFLVGYDHDNAFPWLDVGLEWEGDLRLAPKRAHISERLVQLVAAAEDACHDDPAPPPAGRLDPARVPALAALPRAFRKRPIVCVHPGVGNVVRQWPAASFAGLIDLLVAEKDVNVVLVGAAEEAPIADEVLRLVQSKAAVESLVGRVKLGELAQVMRACVLFVGNNSGPKHLAASLGVPTVGIHSGVVDAAEWAPLGIAAVALRRRMVCGPCYLEFASDCPRSLACLSSIRPRDVLDACTRLMAAA